MKDKSASTTNVYARKEYQPDRATQAAIERTQRRGYISFNRPKPSESTEPHATPVLQAKKT